MNQFQTEEETENEGSTTLSEFAAGSDFGNATTVFCVYGPSGPVVLTMPSSTIPGTIQTIAKVSRAAGKNLSNMYDVLERDQHVLVIKDRSLYVGNLALARDEKGARGTGDPNRYWSQRYIDTMLTAAGLSLSQEHISLYVVGSHPFDIYDEGNQAKIRAILPKKPVSFSIDGKPKTLQRIQIARFLAEGMGAAIEYQIPSKETWGIIDVGYETTDLTVMTGTNSPNDMYTTTIHKGIRLVTDYINQRCLSQYGFELTQFELEKILRAYNADIPANPKVTVDKDIRTYKYLGDTYDTEGYDYPEISSGDGLIGKDHMITWCAMGVQNLADMLKEEISAAWRASSNGTTGIIQPRWNRIQCVGGGCIPLIPHFATIFAPGKLHRSMHPHTDNAKGNAYYAQALLNKKRKA